MDLATQLVERMVMPFDPTTTEDPYRRAVEEMAAGRKPRPIDEAAARRKSMEEDAEVLDLMTALQRSLKVKPDGGKQVVPRAARTASEKRGSHGTRLVKTKPASRSASHRRAAG
jgi:non-homologous end joining protein Ku